MALKDTGKERADHMGLVWFHKFNHYINISQQYAQFLYMSFW